MKYTVCAVRNLKNPQVHIPTGVPNKDKFRYKHPAAAHGGAKIIAFGGSHHD
jgi:hypothetical protein